MNLLLLESICLSPAHKQEYLPFGWDPELVILSLKKLITHDIQILREFIAVKWYYNLTE